MLWFLVLHICMLLIWAGSLLCLPVLISNPSHVVARSQAGKHADSLCRFIFTRLATPAALAAIIFGTIVFLLNRTIAPWLLLKLTLVTALVICHALTGMLIIRAEKGKQQSLRVKCGLLLLVICTLMLAIVFMVLAKPATEVFIWW